MISRRSVLASLMALPAAASVASFAAEPDNREKQSIMGPTVFLWQQMKVEKNKTGEVRHLCKSPTATLDQLEMHISTLNPGLMSHQPHRHVNEELIILRDGECETLSDGKWIKVTPGSVVFNASNSLHAFRNIGSTPATYHVINWSPNKEAGKEA